MGKKLDRAVMKAAVDMSRRGFFKKLAGLGIGTGMGLAGIGQALACDPCQTKTCGSCNRNCRYCTVGTYTYYACRNPCGLLCNAPSQCDFAR